MQRTRIRQVIFRAPEPAPGGGLNATPNVILVEGKKLRLEFDEVGVIATVLDEGRPAKLEDNPSRYPWGVVRKVTGERSEEKPAAKGKSEAAAVV